MTFLHRSTRAGLAPLVFALVFIIAQLGDAVGMPVGFCAVKAFLGIPCPGCGITTSVTALLHGRWAAALEANVAGPFVVLFVFAQLLVAAATAFLPDATIARATRLNDRALRAVLLSAWVIRLAEEV